MPRPILVRVSNIAGEELLQVTVDTSSVGLVLKKQIRKHLHVHPVCQRLLLDQQILSDSERLDSYGIEDSAKEVRLTFIVSDDLAYQQLSSLVPCDRGEAVEALCDVAKLGDEHVIAAFRSCLHDSSGIVRAAAATGLVKVVPQGTSSVVTELCNGLRDPQDFVREAMIEALSKLAIPGDASSADAVLAAWQGLGFSAVTFLIDLSSQGCDHIVEELQGLCLKGDAQHRQMAVRALGCIACSGDLATVDVLMRCARDASAMIRVESVQALTLVTPQGHRDVTSLMLESLRDWNVELKKAALTGLAKLASRGDGHVIAGLCEVVEADFRELRHCAVHGLIQAAPPGHEQATTALQTVEDLDAELAAEVAGWLAQKKTD